MQSEAVMNLLISPEAEPTENISYTGTMLFQTTTVHSLLGQFFVMCILLVPYESTDIFQFSSKNKKTPKN